MLSNIKLSHKGLLIVITLLTFELIFLSFLFLLLKNAEAEAQKAEQANSVVAQANSLMKVFYNVPRGFISYYLQKSDQAASRFDKSADELPKEMARLKKLIAEDEETLVMVNEIDSLVARALVLMRQAKTDMEAGKRLPISTLKREMEPMISAAQARVRKLVDKYDLIANKSKSASANQFRTRIKKLLMIGVGLNIFLAIVLVLSFFRAITYRLGIVSDNTVKFAKGEALNPPLSGGDEIAGLDRVFREMATSLEEAQAKEKKIMASLQASEKRVRSMIDHMPVGLVTINEKGIIDSTNPRTSDLFGYEQYWLAGKHFSILFQQSAQADPSGFMEEVHRKCFNRVGEFTAMDSAGEPVYIEMSLNEFETTEGQLFLANILDVTERHEVEKLKRKFVAMVSHDLQTPLTSIQGSLTLLSAGAMGELNEDAQEIVVASEKEIERLRNLVADLLSASKIESGKIDVHMKEMQLNSVFERSAHSVSSFADQHNVSVDLCQTDVKIMGDEERLVQVLVNLLSNAIKFSPDEGVVKVSTTTSEGWQEVRVTDQGPGIPLKYQDAIFQHFRQEPGQKKGGTGLGLAICKSIIEQHGGTIGVTSEEGKGSTFWFRVSLATAAAASPVEETG